MVVEQLNFTIFDNTQGERFITFFLGHYNYKTQFLSYVNAGHNPPILCRYGEVGEPEILEAGTTILGAFESLPFLETGVRKDLHKFTLHLYTDGLTETMNPADEEYGDEKFTEFIKTNHFDDPTAFHKRFFDELDSFSQGQSRRDDITLLSIKFN
jgi:sigma-B regulation protein RsbU (phosphoserine phosphatase)